jgi:hypothetical protein
MKGVIWEDETLGAKFSDVDIPGDMVDRPRNTARRCWKPPSSSTTSVLAAYPRRQGAR